MSHELYHCGTNTFKESEKRIVDRKRNILYLIAGYLNDHGFRLSANCITQEADLYQFEVCDNVDLDTIIQEYESYYQLKFNKLPKICKKLTQNTQRDIQSAKDIKKTRIGTPKRTVKDNSKDTPTVEPSIDMGIKVTSLSTPSVLTSDPASRLRNEYIEPRNPEIQFATQKPLRDFDGYNSDWKELADVISREILNVDLNVQWDDIQGLDHAKSLLLESVIYPARYPHLFRGILEPWRGVLLHGPPGSGKTLLARAVATQSKATFFNISSSCLISKWRGESEKLIRVLFDLARFNAPSVIFLDEVEALSSHRDAPSEHEASRRLKSELLRQLDGLQPQSNEHVLFLATTNLPWELDPAMLRRLERRILIDLPSEDIRSAMINKLLPLSKNWPVNKMKDILKSTDGYSGADIKLICKETAMGPLREEIKKLEMHKHFKKDMVNQNIQMPPDHEFHPKSLKPYDIKNLEDAITKIKPTASHLTSKYKDWANKFGSA